MLHRLKNASWKLAITGAVAAAIIVVGLAPGAKTAPPSDRRSDVLGGREMAGVAHQLRSMGHRNWIAVVDSAYPLQAASGIKTVTVNVDQLTAVRQVLAMVANTQHVRGTVFVDKELEYVSEQDAPGIADYRKQLTRLLDKHNVQPQLHEQTIEMLDDASKVFNVLIIKTDLTLPYTSVFIRLDCGYWTDAAEARLRAKMGAHK